MADDQLSGVKGLAWGLALSILLWAALAFCVGLAA